MEQSHLQACLIQDVFQLLLNAPGLLLRGPTSSVWGLVPVPIGSSVWFAISVDGCARIVVRKRPWAYSTGVPDLNELASAIAARFKHAEPKESIGQFLFSLDEQLGPCGKACILAHATEENFPWVLPVAKPVLATAALVMDPHSWKDLCELTDGDSRKLVSGGSLPAAAGLKTFFNPYVRGLVTESLLTHAGRERFTATLLDAVDHERLRLDVLARSWCAQSPHPYAIPDWLSDVSIENQIDAYIDSVVADIVAEVQDRRSASEAEGSTGLDVLPTPQAPRPRRPSLVPHIQPVRLLSESPRVDETPQPGS